MENRDQSVASTSHRIGRQINLVQIQVSGNDYEIHNVFNENHHHYSGANPVEQEVEEKAGG